MSKCKQGGEVTCTDRNELRNFFIEKLCMKKPSDP